ncbi:MAG: UDP-N-acetylglucosamine 2-epimerase (non-hydrolyzing) [Elusimicrobia bacterium CG_4_9_14_3_um_filter_62_55]|nr:MAG: UDP-N-acetylglucosamine 2-epimerase (non-hydrolyzing) [Elusimicrobia bacterium CG_4_10_14_0_2_um_filter_63_34]PJB26598.1 MAG: UDP-N-acetylglucosamine 2-epimerase (non-hydrolyzing) [Elusimicrobia bacterium CG_4_9_14_3_um_filter_62_55]
MKKVLCVFGTRPEAIKMAPVVLALRKTPGLRPIVCVTAQHRGMLDQVLRLFKIKPDFDLNLMKPGQSLSPLAADILRGIDRVIEKTRPDWILVQGDTTTVMAASIAAFHRKIKIGHVEAGLRTGDLSAPWPEEANRRVAGLLADLHFAPTATTRKNLLREGVPAARIPVTGNTVIDALLLVKKKLGSDRVLRAALDREYGYLDAAKSLILVTAHRRESHDGGIANICRALKTLAKRGDCQIVYPVHPNPHVRKPAAKALKGVSNVFLIPPPDYAHFIYLMDRCALILTDSGGIQEEAPSLGKPVLVLREKTERPEALAAGAARLAGTQTAAIVKEAARLLDRPDAYAKMAKAKNPYGDGKAAARIARALARAK